MRIIIPSIFVVLALVCVSPVAIASNSVPFNGSATGSFTATSPTTVVLAGTGNYEHLGKTTFAGISTTTGAAACGGFTAAEQDTYTAANGDVVSLSVNDSLCPTSTPHVFQVIGSFTITGGTGRFADASGSGTIQASVVFTSATTGTFSGMTTGTISY